MKDLKINRGVELMLRGPKTKEEIKETPRNSHGFAFTKFFTLLKRRVYFNLELWWDKEKD